MDNSIQIAHGEPERADVTEVPDTAVSETCLARRLEDAGHEVLTMMRGDVDVFGRMSKGLDFSEFDMLPRDAVMEPEGHLGDELDLLAGDPFEEPTDAFPMFHKAVTFFKSREKKPKLARIDSPETFAGFVCDKAVKELERRQNELRALVEEHLADGHGGAGAPLRKWDILGAVKAVSDLTKASNAAEMADSLPKVDVDVPEECEDAVRAWKDGGHVIVSVAFLDAGGSPRIATMGDKPSYADVDEAGSKMIDSGTDPVTILGAIVQTADEICGKRLVKEVCGCALKVHADSEVLGLDDEPVVTMSEGEEDSSAPLAALMYVQQEAEKGDPQAQFEMALMRAAASALPGGKEIAQPILAESSKRLEAGRKKYGLKGHKKSLMQRYSEAAGW